MDLRSQKVFGIAPLSSLSHWQSGLTRHIFFKKEKSRFFLTIGATAHGLVGGWAYSLVAGCGLVGALHRGASQPCGHDHLGTNGAGVTSIERGDEGVAGLRRGDAGAARLRVATTGMGRVRHQGGRPGELRHGRGQPRVGRHGCGRPGEGLMGHVVMARMWRTRSFRGRGKATAV